MMVVANHCAHTLGAAGNFGFAPFGLAFQFGRSGADLFFVLSGFLITLLHQRDIGDAMRFPRYLTQRVTRIYPTYWLVLLLVVPVDAVTHTLFEHYDMPWAIISNVLLLPENDRIFDVTWSLSNELLFYALFGLAICSRIWGVAALAVWIMALTVRSIVAPLHDEAWLNMITYPMNFEFIMGALAGWSFRRWPLRRPIVILSLGLAIFVCFAAAENLQLLWSREEHLWYPGPYQQVVLIRTAGYGTAYTMIIASLAALEMPGKLHVPKALVTLGGASYLLYLVHVPALLILGASERRLHLLRFVPGSVLASLFVIAIAASVIVIHTIIERPMLRAIRSRWLGDRSQNPMSAG